MRHSPIPERQPRLLGQCPKCGVNIHGVPGDVHPCPCCGLSVAPRAARCHIHDARVVPRHWGATVARLNRECLHCGPGTLDTNGTCWGCGHRVAPRGKAKLKRCPSPPGCGNLFAVYDNASKCPWCGLPYGPTTMAASVKKMLGVSPDKPDTGADDALRAPCPRRGRRNRDVARYCGHCGLSFSRTEPEAVDADGRAIDVSTREGYKQCHPPEGCGRVNRADAEKCDRCGLRFMDLPVPTGDVLEGNVHRAFATPCPTCGLDHAPRKPLSRAQRKRRRQRKRDKAQPLTIPCPTCTGRGWVKERYRLLRRRRNYTCGRCKSKGTVWVTPPARGGLKCVGVTSWLEGPRTWRHEWHYVPRNPPHGWKSAVQPPMGAKA